MTARRGLTPAELRELRAQYGSDEEIIAARPELADTLGGLEQWVAQTRAWLDEMKKKQQAWESGRAELVAAGKLEVPEPEVSELELLAEIRDALAAQQSGDAPATSKVGRPAGSYVETETFWVVWKMAVDANASARAIAKDTRESARLEFVNREKAGVIVEWVRAHRAAARRALVAEKLPKDFSATPYGVRLPEPETR